MCMMAAIPAADSRAHCTCEASLTSVFSFGREPRVVFSWLFFAIPHSPSLCQEIPSAANRSQWNVLFVYILTPSSY